MSHNLPRFVKVARSRIYSLLVYATRYTLGRRTYAVSEQIETLRLHWQDLTDPEQGVVLRDIRSALDDAQRAGRTLGDEMDDRAWRALLADPDKADPSAPPSQGEIRLDAEGQLDEVVAADVAHFHLEQMDIGHWWMRLDLRDGTSIDVNLSALRPSTTRIGGRAERDL